MAKYQCNSSETSQKPEPCESRTDLYASQDFSLFLPNGVEYNPIPPSPMDTVLAWIFVTGLVTTAAVTVGIVILGIAAVCNYLWEM